MRKKPCHILISLFVTLPLCYITAQNIPVPSFTWKLVGNLPQAPKGGQTGLAGAFAGASGNSMWIAGGSNFSNGLPWEGGTKIFYDTVLE